MSFLLKMYQLKRPCFNFTLSSISYLCFLSVKTSDLGWKTVDPEQKRKKQALLSIFYKFLFYIYYSFFLIKTTFLDICSVEKTKDVQGFWLFKHFWLMFIKKRIILTKPSQWQNWMSGFSFFSFIHELEDTTVKMQSWFALVTVSSLFLFACSVYKSGY